MIHYLVKPMVGKSTPGRSFASGSNSPHWPTIKDGFTFRILYRALVKRSESESPEGGVAAHRMDLTVQLS